MVTKPRNCPQTDRPLMFSLGPFKTLYSRLYFTFCHTPAPILLHPTCIVCMQFFGAQELNKIWDNCNNLGPGNNHRLQWMLRDASAVQLQRLISRVEAYRMFSEMELPVLRLLSGAFLFWFIKYKFRKFELTLKRRFICERIYLFMHLAPSFR